MAWTVEQAKIYLEIDPVDTSKDAAIQSVLDYVMDTVNKSLGRVLAFGRETVTFYRVTMPRVILPRFPVAQVHAVDDADPPADLRVHSQSGWIEHCSFWGKDELVVDYEGGFAVFPPHLDRTLWEIFMNAWSRTNQDTGGPPADGGATVISGGELERVTISDFGSVSYSTSSVSGGTSAAASIEEIWGWLAPWAPQLEQYRTGYAGAGLGLA